MTDPLEEAFADFMQRRGAKEDYTPWEAFQAGWEAAETTRKRLIAEHVKDTSRGNLVDRTVEAIGRMVNE